MENEGKKVVRCPKCETGFAIPAHLDGGKVRCTKCETEFDIHSSDQPSKLAKKESPESDIDEILKGDDSLIFGRLALRFRFITPEQMAQATALLESEKAQGRDLSLEVILLQKSMISKEQHGFLKAVKHMWETRALDRAFGELALKGGIVSKQDVDDAFKQQEKGFIRTKTVQSIGDILVQWGKISARQRETLLKIQDRPLSEELAEPAEPAPTDLVTRPLRPFSSGEGFDLEIGPDRMEVTLFPAPDTAPPDLETVKKALDTAGVGYGILPDEVIRLYLKEEFGKGLSFVLAKGKPAVPAREDTVKYHFDTDPLKPGRITESGSIDFKERGEIPQVNKAQLIAEILKGEEGEPGIDVSGAPVPVPKPPPVRFRCGTGTEKSPDGLQVYAKFDGRPSITVDGKLQVYPELKIGGDVGLETGHVNFSGHIEVSGSVSDGFRVRGGRLVVQEVLRAEIDVDGDLIVRGGIIGGKIRAGGTVTAKFARRAEIEALGDVVLYKGAIDSKIETSGKCLAEKEKVLSSNICAREGIQAFDIGSERSNPSTLIIGIDERLNKQIAVMKERIVETKKRRQELEASVDALETRFAATSDEMVKLAQIHEQSNAQLKKLKARLEGKKPLSEKEREECEENLRKMQSIGEKAESSMDKLLDEQSEIPEKVDEAKGEIQACEEEIGQLTEDIESLREWSASSKVVPAVRVAGTIFTGTSIRGPRSTVILKKDYSRVRIRETRVPLGDSKFRWEMILSRLT